MKFHTWDQNKNEILKRTRGVSFEQVISLIENHEILDLIRNPSRNHIHQEAYVLKINNYCYLVPFVENEKFIFLKTIIPSRKATHYYLTGKG